MKEGNIGNEMGDGRGKEGRKKDRKYFLDST